MNFEQILNDAELKPWQKTSYFILMIAVVIGGAGLVFATSLYLPNVTYLTDAQRAQILETMFHAWGTISGIAVGGNVVARGGLTLLKQWLQGQVAKSVVVPESSAAQSTPSAPATVADDVRFDPQEFVTDAALDYGADKVKTEIIDDFKAILDKKLG